MSNNDRVQCTDPKCTNKYGANSSMRQHYIAKHTEESLKRGSRAAHPTVKQPSRIMTIASNTSENSTNFTTVAGYADARGLREHRKAAHTGNNQPHSNPRPPSKTIDVVPQPEPVLNEETKQPMPNECRIPVVYNGNLVQGIEPTAKWYEFIYKAGATPMVKDDKGIIHHPEYWIDGRKFSQGEKRWFDSLCKFNFFVSSTFHGRMCDVCRSEMGHWWKGLRERFFGMTLEQRVEYMLYWCDKEKRERGFREADAILLKLFEGFNIEEEMRVHFADRDERRWNKFNRNRVTKKECVAWNNDGKYRLGACIYIPQRLNFAKELLDDFKTSRLFQGTDLENFRKGIQVLRDLMIETAEKIRHRLPKLLGEHVAPIAGFEDGDNSEVHVAEGIPENSCDQYPEPDDMTSIDCINQDTVTTIDNMIESGKDDYEFSTSDSWDYETFSYNRL
ncbi:hypothetical protein EDD21DRAFT_419201 [Dissophora ornata]|nr:hypothetical protein EDD21DRAFT_419201 [Dissophora ornata]